MDEAHCRVLMATSDRRVAVLTFSGCTQTVYGYPNDEAQAGHPLYSNWAYGVYEVIGSDWLERLQLQNETKFPNVRWEAKKRHFIVAFHELMGEFLADDVHVDVSDVEFDQFAVSALLSVLGDDARPSIIPA
jgi:hypothetical protein